MMFTEIVSILKLLVILENLFNFNSSVGYIFKDSASVAINDEFRDEYKDVLKHDTIFNKLPTFAQYEKIF